MLDERKTSILRAVVQEYIEHRAARRVDPCRPLPGVRCQSATVRNEMAVLEQEGYLAQPHTSAGRVPTDKGYRFFVDHLTSPAGSSACIAAGREFFDTSPRRARGVAAPDHHLLAQVSPTTPPSSSARRRRRPRSARCRSSASRARVAHGRRRASQRHVESQHHRARRRHLPTPARRRRPPTCVGDLVGSHAGAVGTVPRAGDAGGRRPVRWPPWLARPRAPADDDACSSAGRPAWRARSTPSTPSATCSPRSSSSTSWCRCSATSSIAACTVAIGAEHGVEPLAVVLGGGGAR